MAFYDNTREFRRFAIYKNGKLVRVSHEILLWYENLCKIECGNLYDEWL